MQTLDGPEVIFNITNETVDSTVLNVTFNVSTDGLYENTTFDVHEYIKLHLGPPRMRYTTLIPQTVLYALIAMSGVVGNFLTCLVVARNHSMRTSTNYYLVNLAVADLIALCFTLPMEVYTVWVQYPWPLGDAVCRLRAVVAESLNIVSILTILAVSGERYVAITDPVIARTTHTLTRTTRVLPAIWLVALLAASPWGYYQQVNHLRLGSSIILESAWCAISFHESYDSLPWVMWMSSVFGFIMPMLILIILYYKIGVVLSIDPPSRTPSAGNGAMHTRRMGIRMLVAVVVVFFLCWAPFHAQRLMFVFVNLYGTWTKNLRTVNQRLYVVAGICYYLNSAMNPILYSVMSVRFRIAFRRTLCGGREWARRQQYLSNTYGAHLHSNTSNTLNRTREVSTTSTTKYITRAGSKRMGLPDFCSRNGFNYVFEHMEIEA
ncbi:neuromedin-U receptor 2-like isoform X1 [Macrobrachium nipponense]|uniref:neuromedin-U receptor 2-like isoform X1 n=1 Tax=Macrobrachium nipponense TaxID=159736 RepID=UPI0030C872B9